MNEPRYLGERPTYRQLDYWTRRAGSCILRMGRRLVAGGNAIGANTSCT